MKLRRFILGAVLLAAIPAFPQQLPIEHAPAECLKTRNYNVMFATTKAEGDARLYFRREGATEWCYVEGVRTLNTIRAILPQFELGAVVEYFFITVKEGEVTARSPRIFRAQVRNQCDMLGAQSVDFLLNACEGEAGGLGSAMAAAYAIQITPADDPVTPSEPN